MYILTNLYLLLGAATLGITQSDCTVETVVAGDTCVALATRCGVTLDQIQQFNPTENFCPGLVPGQRICCSPGQLPDLRPKPNSDGSCAVYTVQQNDLCSTIASAHSLKVQDIENFNVQTTWGWSGCQSLMEQLSICLSTGKPPMPAPIPNAVCGPVKPGSNPPLPSQNLADLNPCPLNTCCNIWGQCGITEDYCMVETGSTGNPGTAPPGRNGCVSNCGTDVKKTPSQAPFMKVGYYESWNWDRDCLNMRVADLGSMDYTHVHWSFATIDDGMDILIDDEFQQFPDFLNLTGPRKVVSFGGWGFSTDPTTYGKLRTAVDPINRDRFASNVVAFIQQHNLDGVDFDWEYPGAPDIPDIPAGLPTDAPNYLAFLQLLRSKMPQGKSISIAAPASYWYLKQFPIAEMAVSLDYIVYMTYDLHGQWDYGNKFAQEGCATGNCLRSHVNLTETMYALAMITKAGAPSGKVCVGVSSYGRSFGMLQAGCSGPTCLFGGKESTATPGRCTVSPGYISNAEINEIIALAEVPVQSFHDKNSDSDILVYNNDQWVAYMSDDTKQGRIARYRNLGFAGTVDWAVDLQAFGDDDDNPSGDEDEDYGPDTPVPDCDATFASLEDFGGAIGSFPEECETKYLASTLQNVLKSSVNKYNEILSKGYDNKFRTYAKSVAGSAGSTIRDFVNKNGNQYFTCVIGETSVCCDHCKKSTVPASQCNYCFNGQCTQTCSSLTGCPHDSSMNMHMMNRMAKNAASGTSGSAVTGQMTNGQLLGHANLVGLHGDNRQVPIRGPVEHEHIMPGGIQLPILKSTKQAEPCPPDFSQRGFGPNNPYEQSVWWTLREDKADQFWADLFASTGVSKNKINFADYERDNSCISPTRPDDPCWFSGMDFGMPTPKGFGVNDVLNPKASVQKALGNSNNLADQLADVVEDLNTDCYHDDPSELIDFISIPILMIAQAVDNMAEVAEAGEKMEEEQRKAIILAFVSAILFIIPVAGEVVGSVAEMADIAAITGIIGAAGNAAMDIYTIVDDPQNAPLAIFDLILAPLALADIAIITQAANIRRGMTDADVARLGGKVSQRMGIIRKITGVCKKI